MEARITLQVGQVVETLRACTHQAFPVTPDVVKAYESAEPFDLHGESYLLHLSAMCCYSIPQADGESRWR